MLNQKTSTTERKTKSAAEKVLLNKKSNFFYLNRGIKRTPIGTEVEIIRCNNGIMVSGKSLKGTVAYALRNKSGQYKGQLIAFSNDTEDLQLFAMEYNWNLTNPFYE